MLAWPLIEVKFDIGTIKKWPFDRWLEVTAVGRFFYESLTISLTGTFSTDHWSGGARWFHCILYKQVRKIFKYSNKALGIHIEYIPRWYCFLEGKYILKEFLKTSLPNHVIDGLLCSSAWHPSLLTCLACLRGCYLVCFMCSFVSFDWHSNTYIKKLHIFLLISNIILKEAGNSIAIK